MKRPLEKSDGGMASSAVRPAAVQPAALTRSVSVSLSTIRGRMADYLELTKPRISVLVLLVTAVGFCFGSTAGVDLLLMANALFGTALVAVGANTLNQYMEWRFDRLMHRTAGRPIPAGRITPAEAGVFGVSSAVAGLAWLTLLVNWYAAFLAAVTIGLYLLAYTPLKRLTILNTLVGAVPGALPPMIGFAAASGRIDVQAWILFAIVFTWQMPHFFAIAWMYREDYARGGYRMISTADADGFKTGGWIVTWTVALVAVSFLPVWAGTAGAAYCVGTTALGVFLALVGLRTAARRSTSSARLMLLASVVYLPALMLLMLFDRVGA